jgi:methionine--tRNA ligase beta chain
MDCRAFAAPKGLRPRGRVEPGNDEEGASPHKEHTWSHRTTSRQPQSSRSYLADLEKLDIRIGTIELVEDVPASDKLVRLRVDFGDHKRTILVGMKKERNNPKSEMEGRQALFVVNLPSRKIAGEESQGMLFDIGYADGLSPALAVPERPMPNGCRAG